MVLIRARPSQPTHAPHPRSLCSDNGPHCDETTKLWPEVHCGGIHIGRSSGGQGVTKGVGLRGCKASNWEGGIR